MKIICRLLAISLLMISCKADENNNIEDERSVIVSFDLNGEIEFSDKPFGGRISNSDEYTIYGIQIESVISNTGEGEIISQPYAKGIFDDLSDVEVSLIEGNEYVVEATAFRKGTAFGLVRYQDPDSYEIFFATPFNAAMENRFVYSSQSSTNFTSSTTTYYADADSLNTVFSFRPEITRYVSPKTTFFAEEDMVVSIDLIRANFGVEVHADNLTSGTINVRLDDVEGNIILDPENTSSDTRILQFNSFIARLNEMSDYKETIGLSVTYEVEIDGELITDPIFLGSIEFKKDFIKRILISIPDPAGSSKSGFSISLEDVEMSYDTLQID